AVKAIGYRRERCKTGLNQLHKLGVVQISSRGNDDVVGRESLAIKIEQFNLLKRPHRLLSPQNRFAQRMVCPEVLGKDLVNKVVGIVLIHFDLFQNHAFFASDVLGIENRIQHQVAEDIKGDGHMLIQHLN